MSEHPESGNTIDLSRNLVMKEDYAFVVMDDSGFVDGGERGLYSHDTRFLSRYVWRFGSRFQTLVRHSESPDQYIFYYADIEGPSQRVGITRHLRLGPRRFEDVVVVENTSPEPIELSLRLDVRADFIDMFEARGFQRRRSGAPLVAADTGSFRVTYDNGPGVSMRLEIRVEEGDADAADEEGLTLRLRLPAGTEERIRLATTLEAGVATHPNPMGYEQWRSGFPAELTDFRRDWKRALVLSHAIDDLRALLLYTPEGPVSAAGIPWFVAVFGRDALLTAYMLLPYHPEVARATLRVLGGMQGSRESDFHAEQPGKIPHERRYGELTVLGEVPHSPYFGTIDATPLFVILLERLVEITGDTALLAELRPVWEAALAWIVRYAQGRGPFLRYVGAVKGQGLVVQSWKDSDDSMSHADGRLAGGSVAPVEVQGYGYAAFRAAERFYRRLGEGQAAADWGARATLLREAIEERFWIEELGTYAMALDGEDVPLAVLSSNAGHLLWSGVPSEERAAKLAATLFSPELWSGWGVRTLGSGEKRYNPMSYHNGSVWPHDNALIAAGLARYGHGDRARRIRDALFDLAESQDDNRLPELIAGYPRKSGPPIPYPVACRPQAWDAAALIFLADLGGGGGR